MALTSLNRCRVTHVITRLIVGGAQENTVASVVGLHAKADLVVKLISGPTHGAEGSLGGLVPPGVLEIVPTLVRPINPWQDLSAWRSLKRAFRAERSEIVHTHSGKAGIVGRLAAASAGVPIIVHTIHGPSFGKFQGPMANLAFTAAEKYAGKVTTHFVSVAQAMTRQYLDAGIGTVRQFTRIPSGFELEPFLDVRGDTGVRKQLGLTHDDIVVGKIARLVPLKGHDDLIAMAPELIKACPRIRFLLVGDGPWRRRLERQIASSGMTRNFVFAGLVTPSDMPSMLGAMDMLVHLSRREGLARALTQALAAARPIVAVDCDGANEVCLDGQTGYLVRPDDTKSLLERTLALARDPQLRARFGAQGRSLVKQQFSVETMVESLHGLYRQLLAERAKNGLSGA